MPYDEATAPAYVSLGDGVLVERDVLGIARRVTEYDPNLAVQFLNSPDCSVTDPPYRIVEKCTDGIVRPLFSVWNLDETVLHRIWASDTQKQDVLSNLNRTNQKARNSSQKRYRQEMDAAKEIVKTVVASPKDTYTVPETVVLGDKGDESRNIIFRAKPGPTRQKKI